RRRIGVDAHDVDAEMLAPVLDAAADVIRTRNLEDPAHQLLGVQLATGIVGATDAALQRTGIDFRDVLRLVALRRNAEADLEDVLFDVVIGVGDALDEAGAADHNVDALVADELLRGLSGHVELRLVVFVMIGDRTAVDAAVRVDAIKIRLRGFVGFLEAADAAHRRHGADRDRLAGRRLTRVQTAIRLSRRHGRAAANQQRSREQASRYA